MHGRSGAARGRWRGSGRLGAAALLLVFVVLARMVEIRSDTLGLLLMNAAWALLLGGRSVRRLVAAAVLGGLALLFSARAPGMVGVFGLLLLYLTVHARHWAAVRALLLVAGGFVAAGALVYPGCSGMGHARHTFLLHGPRAGDPPGHDPGHALLPAGAHPAHAADRGRPARGAAADANPHRERGVIVAVACGGQILMIVLDPLPFEYVYGWAAVPVVFGLVSVSARWASAIPAAFAAALLAGAAGYALKGESPPNVSLFHLTLDAALREEDLARLAAPELVSLIVTDRGQRNLTGQLRVRSEVCRRLGGKILATFDTNPVCLHDAFFHWAGVRWPPLVQGDVRTPEAPSSEAFGRELIGAGPSVFIWAHRWESPRPVLPTTRRMLECCYDIHDGFALKKAAR
ncbi:hypothetical protein HK414_09720 [Ramlibacter terrae]|uniref:Uncharacterized protein n=1 Tax=Ramlibacter terrae TaxID=2732511 RepID=A0ABX6P1U0_9BURK|nr:hypothetical protein HK414_09720 [Ramlibacter terrae]